MGSAYLAASKMMAERQKISIEYVGFEQWIFQDQHFINGSVAFINSCGSIEQALYRYMDGERHDIHHDAKRLTWIVTSKLQEVLENVFVQVHRLLRSKGVFLIVANGSSCDTDYDYLIREAADKSRMKLIFQEGLLIHKWMKE